MSYRVVWRRKAYRAIQALAFIARERGDPRELVLHAVEEIELRLALSPLVEGESRSDTERVLIVPPLSARYEVFESEDVVLIYSVVHYPRMQL